MAQVWCELSGVPVGRCLSAADSFRRMGVIRSIFERYGVIVFPWSLCCCCGYALLCLLVFFVVLVLCVCVFVCVRSRARVYVVCVLVCVC